LVVVTFVSDVDDGEWKYFCRTVACISAEIKVIIITRMRSLARYGTVEPIHLSRLQDEEFMYLFKTLAFGSAQAQDHPKLTLLAGEFVKIMGGSFVAAYPFAYTLRRDLSLRLWLRTLNILKSVTKNNLFVYGEHLSHPYIPHYPIDLTAFLPPPAAPLHIMPPRTEAEVSQRKLRPKGDFDLVTWKSPIPPYSEFCYHVPSCAQQKPIKTSRKKREATLCL
jgi:hypothetical protein